MIKPNYYAIIPANVRYDAELSANAKLLYGEITSLSNAEGFCWASNAYFAELYNVSKRSVQGWISQLEDKGFIRVQIDTTQPNESTRKIYISTGEPLQGHEKNFTTPHEKNFTHNNTSINTKTNNKKNNKNNRAISADLEEEFERLWKLYPRKLGKKKAFDSFKKARKIKKVPYETIENGLYRYISYIKNQEIEEQFVQHGSTWFNQEKWQDEYVSVQSRKKPRNAFEYYQMEYGDGGRSYEPDRNCEIIDYHSEVIPESFQGI